jgi:hypothetical protein
MAVFLVGALTLVMHVIGCLWYYLVNSNGVWIPPFDFIEAGNSEIYRFYYEENDWVSRYITCLYNALMALGGNEMGPRTDIEIITMFFILEGCVIFESIFIGEFTFAIDQGSIKQKFFQE